MANAEWKNCPFLDEHEDNGISKRKYKIPTFILTIMSFVFFVSSGFYGYIVSKFLPIYLEKSTYPGVFRDPVFIFLTIIISCSGYLLFMLGILTKKTATILEGRIWKID